MENPIDGETIIRETTEAMKREMDFYRELKRRRNAMAICRPKTELTPQQEQAYQQSRCDPELREVAKAILEEVQYNRNERSMGYRVFFIVMGIAIGVMIIMYTTIFLTVKGSKYKTKH